MWEQHEQWTKIYNISTLGWSEHIFPLMSEVLSAPSFYNLMYSDKDSDSEPGLPLLPLPINYHSIFSAKDEHPQSALAIEAYDDSYLVEQQLNAKWSEASNNTEMNHPGPP